MVKEERKQILPSSRSTNLVHRKVLTSDLEPVGEVYMEDESLLTIRDGLAWWYAVPKAHIEAISDKVVVLKLSLRELRKYALK
jgi:hypothetical protein